jgi:hypothetical protein
MTSLWTADSFRKMCDARKDTYYRFLNQERFNPTTTFYYAWPSLRPSFFDATDKQGDSCTESIAPFPALYPRRKFSRAVQRFIHVESSQGQNYLQENPKLRERNGWSFFPNLIFKCQRKKWASMHVNMWWFHPANFLTSY